MKLPVAIYSADTVRRIDRSAIETAGIGGYTLMTRAAEASLDAARASYPAKKNWLLLCGAGNNGGDGYVLARLAAGQGVAVSVLALAPPEALEGDARTAYRDFVAAGGTVQCWDGQLDPRAELLVDAILGSGLSRPVEGTYAQAIDALNRHPAPVLALDIPSGLSSDSGAVLGVAVRADLTVTFVGLKAGLFLLEGPDHTGQLRFAGLDIPKDCRDSFPPTMRRIDDAALRDALPRRARAAHKGDFGNVLVIGGAPGMAGAARLCAEAALRCGAGRVTVATDPAHCAAINAGRPEIMCHGMTEPAGIEPLLDGADAVAIGPGLGTTEWGRRLWAHVRRRQLPTVVDADALNLLAQAPDRADHWILTPHPGEAGRMLGCPAGEVQSGRLAALQSLTERYGGTVVLKGAGTLVSADDGAPWLCTAGNPGMATAGMGDVLTGVIAGMLAQGMTRQTAAIAGVAAHARAGDAAAGNAPRGLLASDLLSCLRRVVNPRP